MATKNSTRLIEATRELFGEHPEDVISPMETAAEGFCWIEEIFNVIKQEAKDGNACGLRVEHLAGAGAYITLNIGDYVGCRYEEMISRLISHEVVTRAVDGEEKAHV